MLQCLGTLQIHAHPQTHGAEQSLSPFAEGVQGSRATSTAPDGRLQDTESPSGSAPRTMTTEVVRTYPAAVVCGTGAATKKSHTWHLPSEERAHADEDKQGAQLTWKGTIPIQVMTVCQAHSHIQC